MNEMNTLKESIATEYGPFTLVLREGLTTDDLDVIVIITPESPTQIIQDWKELILEDPAEEMNYCIVIKGNRLGFNKIIFLNPTTNETAWAVMEGEYEMSFSTDEVLV